MLRMKLWRYLIVSVKACTCNIGSMLSKSDGSRRYCLSSKLERANVNVACRLTSHTRTPIECCYRQYVMKAIEVFVDFLLWFSYACCIAYSRCWNSTTGVQIRQITIFRSFRTFVAPPRFILTFNPQKLRQNLSLYCRFIRWKWRKASVRSVQISPDIVKLPFCPFKHSSFSVSILCMKRR